MEKLIRVGMDTSKSVFRLHGVNEREEPVLRRKLRRKEMIKFFAGLAPTVVDAGPSAKHDDREVKRDRDHKLVRHARA